MKKFRELKVGDKFWFASAHDGEIRMKVAWRKYVDVSNNGEPGNKEWVKKVSGESLVIPIDVDK